MDARPAGGSGGAAGAGRPAVVIGAGVVGVCCALWLQRDGWDVTVLDPRPPGEGCSFGNAGIQVHRISLPIATPGIVWRVPGMLRDPLGPLAVRWRYLPRAAPWLLRFVRAGSAAAVERITAELGTLARQVRETWSPLIEAAGAGDLVRRTGVVQVYETRAAFEAARAEFALRRRHGDEVQELGPEELRQLAPALAPVFAGGAFRPENGFVADPLGLTQALAAAFERGGGRFVRAAASAIETDGDGGMSAVAGEAGRHPAALAVVAAGAWSRPLARGLGVDVPLDTERGYHVMLPEPGVELRLPVNIAEGGFYMTPMAHGLRVAGTVEIAGLDAPPDWRRADVLLAQARRYLPGLGEAGATRWMGFRPSMPDSKPVIGPVPGRRGAYLAFGHGHIGLSLAAATGRAIADMAAGRPTAADMTPFRADRFQSPARPSL